jgi:hypothetical protein
MCRTPSGRFLHNKNQLTVDRALGTLTSAEARDEEEKQKEDIEEVREDFPNGDRLSSAVVPCLVFLASL